MSKLVLPIAPPAQTGPVRAWVEPVTLNTYEPMPPDKNPMFLEKRVYQGSSGRVYPLPFIDRIATEPREHSWNALHIENEFLRLMILPEIGGRIHVGLDKTNQYDFFYRQNVIKPALVGLAGPWISGGVEFNWPQHHRPATFMAVDYEIEEGQDGSRTIWCSGHDPMTRMRGMHGICLHPGRAIVELKVRLCNRTPLAQTFLWWANMGVHVNERYQSFFPPDVHFVADHARRAMSTFPLCQGSYYGIDYGARAQNHTGPDGYAANDLGWYANIPVPTSYMALGSQEDFMGGYDHARQAGVVHVANHRISPGKKQWTWGNDEFGCAWQRNLTDEDGPYVELMAGVYTDNQPDFSFLAPGETRTFSQYWYPIRDIGPAQKANREAALSLSFNAGLARVGLCVTKLFENARIILECQGRIVAQWQTDLQPSSPFVGTAETPEGSRASDFTLQVSTSCGRELIAYQPRHAESAEAAPAAEPLLPTQMKTNEELYLTGLHLEQYRHATRLPEEYWREALRRDPADARCNNAIGLWHLRRGEFATAETFLQAAIARLTRLNANPYNGEAFYYLGVTLRFMGHFDAAYDSFYKATWNWTWRGPSFLALAEIDAGKHDWNSSLEHADRAMRCDADNLNTRNLAALVLRELGRKDETGEMLRQTLQLDPLDPLARHISGQVSPPDNQIRLDVALDYMRTGFYQDACDVLKSADYGAINGSVPMLHYARAFCERQLDHESECRVQLTQARQAPPQYCFPSRLEELLILEFAVEQNPNDARAHYYLGNLLYDRRRHQEALNHWEKAAELDAAFPTAWRNLGIAYFNVLHDAEKAAKAFQKAFAADPTDGRVFYELDQLAKRSGISPDKRSDHMEAHLELVAMRDDLSVELATLYNQTGKPEQALTILLDRTFQPWEGGEGLALGQYARSHLAVGRKALLAGSFQEAANRFERALSSPRNLGEAKHPLANLSNIWYWLGEAYRALGRESEARAWWTKASTRIGDFQNMSLNAFSEMTYYSALALERLGSRNEAQQLFTQLAEYAANLLRQKPKIDYFATSLPDMLLFEEDLDGRNRITATFLQAQAQLGLGNQKRARQLLKRVLKLDPNHASAAELVEEIKYQAHLRQSATVEV